MGSACCGQCFRFLFALVNALFLVSIKSVVNVLSVIVIIGDTALLQCICEYVSESIVQVLRLKYWLLTLLSLSLKNVC